MSFLNPIQIAQKHSGLEGIDCLYVINLDERPQRWQQAKSQFDAQGLTPNRVSAINGWNIPVEKLRPLLDEDSPFFANSPGGTLGCLLSHMCIYKDALERGFQTVWICEDDIEFKESAANIASAVEKLSRLDPEWDLLYTDYCTKGVGKQNPRPEQAPYEEMEYSIAEDLLRVHGRYNTHSMIFSRNGLRKAYHYFTHVLLWSPIDVDIHYTPELREYSVKNDLVTSINDSSVLAIDGSSDTQPISSLNRK